MTHAAISAEHTTNVLVHIPPPRTNAITRTQAHLHVGKTRVHVYTIGRYLWRIQFLSRNAKRGTMSLYVFDHELLNVYDDGPHFECHSTQQKKSYVPRGSTSLLDALGRVLTKDYKWNQSYY